MEYATALGKCPTKWTEKREAGVEWLKGFIKTQTCHFENQKTQACRDQQALTNIMLWHSTTIIKKY